MSVKSNRTLDEFEKKKDYLICVDSDGCVMNTMDIKHIRCFGPSLIKEWGLEQWENEILKRWNEINLYSMTRGINRFKGVALMLQEVNQKYTPIEGVEDLLKWTQEVNELSGEVLTQVIEQTGKTIYKKALAWSEAVNEGINQLEDQDKLPFEVALEGLITAQQYGDVAIVSSANLQAVLEEWEEHQLLEHTDVVLAQNVGNKTYCISKLLEKGYDKDKAIMIGDARGDYEAAQKNGILYYPIFVGKEKKSWECFIEEAVVLFAKGEFVGAYQEELIENFKRNLAFE